MGAVGTVVVRVAVVSVAVKVEVARLEDCLLYRSDAADDLLRLVRVGRRIVRQTE